LVWFFLLCLFFFQAEDGIRDLYVTGVQTCALPISTLCALARACRTAPAVDRRRPYARRRDQGRTGWVADSRGAARREGRSQGSRSEERRVGKECRSRWSPEQ